MITARPRGRTRALAAALGLALTGCGSAARPLGSTTASTPSAPGSVTGSSQLPAAEHPRLSQFPPARGRTLQQVAALARSSAQLGAATEAFTPGRRRVAFGLNTGAGAFLYAPTALYVATQPNAPAQGPFLAPADPLGVSVQFRSTQNAGPGGVEAIYAAQVPVAHPGTYVLLALTDTPAGLIGSPGEIAVAPSLPIPDVGQRPPPVATDTPASVNGRTALLSTRAPPDDMHAASFRDVLGQRPIALLFSTPQLCQSRVCGPVTDIAAELEQRYGGQVTFIHEEVFVNNRPSQGYRPALKAFHLRTEPWLFTIDRRGVIAARLEGAFGVDAFTQALQAALR